MSSVDKVVVGEHVSEFGVYRAVLVVHSYTVLLHVARRTIDVT